MANDASSTGAKRYKILGKEFSIAGIEMTVLIGVITLTPAAYFGFLPNDLKFLKTQSAPEIFALTFLFFLTIGRLNMSLTYLFLKQGKVFHWALFAIFGVMTAWLYSYAVSSQQIPEGPIVVKQAIFHLHIKDNGDATVRRERVFTPLKDLQKLAETDFYSSGGLSKDDFTVWVKKKLGDDSVAVDVQEFSLGRFVNVFPHDKQLRQGCDYVMTTTIEARGAFKDSVKDNFQVELIHETGYLEWRIQFDKSKKINTYTVSFLKLKAEGIALLPAKEFVPLGPKLNSTYIHGYYGKGECIPVDSQAQIKKFDQYGIFWEYLPR